MVKKTEQYRLENLSCANCAAKFERNVRGIETVEDVQLNFGAAKLTVMGDVTVEQLEQAGAFDGIKVSLAKDRKVVKKEPIYKQKENQLALLSLLFVIAGFISSVSLGEGHVVVMGLYAIAIIVGGYSIFITGIKNLLHFDFDMKTLITIAIIGAAIIGEWQEAAIVVFLFAVSEVLETYSMNKARQSISQLIDIAPSHALIKRAHGEHFHEMEVTTDAIRIGDTLIIKPGQKIAMDGVVTAGTSTVNQAAITGESIPVTKTEGDSVFAGTLNENGSLEVNVTKRVEDTTIAKIIHLVEEAQAEKAPSQKFVDRFAKYYTPAILIVALIVALVPGGITGDWSHWVYQGLAVLVVGCPCALVISTPVAIVTAIGNHDEGTGVPVNTVAAAMILADKADVRRSRVRNTDISKFDIHDRVNYSVKKAVLKINEDKTIVKLKLTVDTKFGSVMDYFEIFMTRMVLCRKAAEKLGLQFKLIINEQQLI